MEHLCSTTSLSWQRELSRRAAEQYELKVALAERRARRPATPPRLRRVRHGLAVTLVATARLIDAT
jgi:hypothetical protein